MRQLDSRRSSHYLPMRDGARIAVDVHLPPTAEPVATIVRQTRYFRSTDIPAWALELIGEDTLDPTNAKLRRAFVGHGYAWVDVDVRGSGASTGVWHCPWSPLEVADGAEVVDWIVRQPWSNGVVGATGNSYDGTAAELLATTCHPAVRAVAPRCSLYDVYTDVAYPGGLHQAWFTAAWTRANMALDANHPERMIAEAVAQAHPRLLEAGLRRRVLEAALRQIFRRVRTVDGDAGAVATAVAEHAANVDLDAVARSVEFRDDLHPSPLGDQTIDAFSPSAYLDRMRASGVAVLGISGWFDAAYQGAAIARHRAVGGRLVLGPWNHGAGMNMSPHARDRRPGFALADELVRFFDHHLRGRATGLEAEPAVRYYVMGAETWREAATWPPPEVTPRRWHLGAGRTLAATAPAAPADDVLDIDDECGSGRRSRWRTLVSPFVRADYPDRARRDRDLLVYSSAPLVEPVEIAGAPVVGVSLRSDGDDGALFAYLEAELPDGRIVYITEGQLRLIHAAAPRDQRTFRRAETRPLVPGAPTWVEFALLPTAYQFARGTRIRLALAGADLDHFAPVLTDRPSTRYTLAGGWLELPIYAAGSM